MSSAFAMWLRERHTNLSGTIQQPDGAKQKAYVRPDAFPEERLFFSYKDWPITRRHRALQGEPVLFDIQPQPRWTPRLNAEATNVRPLAEVSSEQLPSRLHTRTA